MRSGGKGDAIPLIQFFEMPRPVGGVIHLNFIEEFLISFKISRMVLLELAK